MKGSLPFWKRLRCLVKRAGRAWGGAVGFIRELVHYREFFSPFPSLPLSSLLPLILAPAAPRSSLVLRAHVES